MIRDDYMVISLKKLIKKIFSYMNIFGRMASGKKLII
jgi:hypothetical protein